jgi:hypothetical protein
MMNTRAVANRYSHILRTASPETIAAGRAWYPNARHTVATLAMVHNVTPQQSALVVASLSPRVHWSRNVRMADSFLRNGTANGLGTSAIRASKALEGGLDTINPASAPKVYAFALNLLGDDQAVTVDMWMLAAAGLPGNLKLTSANRYNTLADIITRLARRNDLTPAETQAIIWVAQRGRAD